MFVDWACVITTERMPQSWAQGLHRVLPVPTYGLAGMRQYICTWMCVRIPSTYIVLSNMQDWVYGYVCDEIKLFPPTCGHRLQPIDTDPSKYILMCVYIREELLTFTVGICGLYSQQQLLIDILIL